MKCYREIIIDLRQINPNFQVLLMQTLKLGNTQLTLVDETDTPLSNIGSEEVALMSSVMTPSEELTERTSLLCQYTFNQFAVNENIETVGCLRQSCVYIGCATSTVCSYVSWYPIIMGIFDLDINQFLKIMFAGGSWTSYGGLYAWGTVSIVYDQFKFRTATENELLKKPKRPFLTTAYKVMIAIMGSGACLPNAYFAYTLNQENKVPWTIVNIIGSWGINTYPIHTMFLDTMLPRWKICRPICNRDYYMKEKWNGIRDYLAESLTTLEERIPQMSVANLRSLCQPLDTDESERNGEYAARFFANLPKCQDPSIRVRSLINSRSIQYPVKIVSAFLPISNIYANAVATFEFVDLLTDSFLAKVIIVPIALSPSYLMYSLNRDFFLIVIEKFANRHFKKKVETLGGNHFPKTRMLLICTAVVISLLSSAIDYATARKIYPENNTLDWLAVIASITNSVALTLIPVVSLSILIHNFYMRRWKNPDIIYKLDTIQKVQQLQFYIKRSSEQEIKLFVNQLLRHEGLKEEFSNAFPWLEHEVETIGYRPSTDLGN